MESKSTQASPDYQFKIIILGDYGVGKTSIH